MEQAAQRLLHLNDNESVVSGSSRYENRIPYMVQIPPARLPEMTEEFVNVSVCHVEDPNRFWVQRLDTLSISCHDAIGNAAGENGCNLKRTFDHPIKKGCLVMGPFREGSDRSYYRAKVLSVQQGVPDILRRAKLYFIDYGNPTEVLLSELRPIPDDLLAYPPLAYECRLTGVGPSLIHDPKGKWTEEATEWFRDEMFNKSSLSKVTKE